MTRGCKKCGAALYQAEHLKRFSLLCLAKEIEARAREDDVSGAWGILHPITRPVTLRLSEADLARAKEKARKLRDGNVSVIDTVTNAVGGTVAVGVAPRGVAVAP